MTVRSPRMWWVTPCVGVGGALRSAGKVSGRRAVGSPPGAPEEVVEDRSE